MNTVPKGPASRVTIADIAERSGVSIGAVSFALNGRKGVSERTRERVLAVADELGWAPASAARSLAGARTETIGLVIARDASLLGTDSFYMRFIAGLGAELEDKGFGLLLRVVPGVDEAISTMTAWRNARRVDGVVLTDLEVGDPRIPLATAPGALPAVVVGDPEVAGGLTSIGTDDAAAMKAAVRHLSDLGHRRIARVSGPAEYVHTGTRDRAYRSAMAELGLAPVVLPTDYSAASGADTMRALLQSEPPATAVIYDNDVMALAGLSVAQQAGHRVPDDLSIVAWDDSVMCEHTNPPLSAISHDVVAFGSHVARRLLAVVDGAAPAAFADATPVLTTRGSTGPR